MANGTEVNSVDAGVRYFFIVSRKSPEILARVQDRLHGDPRIEVIADRRHGERRRAAAPHAPERRGGDRRRPTNVWNDLTIYPTLVAQRHVDSYAELEQKAARASEDAHRLAAENEHLREALGGVARRVVALCAEEQQRNAENSRLREEIADLHRRLAAFAAAEAEFKADVSALLEQAEQALGTLITQFRLLTVDARQAPKEPRLRSL